VVHRVSMSLPWAEANQPRQCLREFLESKKINVGRDYFG